MLVADTDHLNVLCRYLELFQYIADGCRFIDIQLKPILHAVFVFLYFINQVQSAVQSHADFTQNISPFVNRIRAQLIVRPSKSSDGVLEPLISIFLITASDVVFSLRAIMRSTIPSSGIVFNRI